MSVRSKLGLKGIAFDVDMAAMPFTSWQAGNKQRTHTKNIHTKCERTITSFNENKNDTGLNIRRKFRAATSGHHCRLAPWTPKNGRPAQTPSSYINYVSGNNYRMYTVCQRVITSGAPRKGKSAANKCMYFRRSSLAACEPARVSVASGRIKYDRNYALIASV